MISEVNDPSKEVKVRFMRKLGQYFLLSKKLEKWFPKSAIYHRCSYHPLAIGCIIPLMPLILKVCVIKRKHTLDRDFKMDLHICNKKEVVDIEKNSTACSCVSHKPLMYPTEDNCCKR